MLNYQRVYEMENKRNVPNHQPAMDLSTSPCPSSPDGLIPHPQVFMAGGTVPYTSIYIYCDIYIYF
jgi:hypothetical protein